MPVRIVVNIAQLREALRVAEAADEKLARTSDTDSLQIHLTEPDETVLGVEFLSNEEGCEVGSFTIDSYQSPGETGVATAVA